MVLNENNLRKHGALTSRQVALTFKPWHSTHSPTSFKLRLHSLEQSLPDSSLVRNEAEGSGDSCPSRPAEYEGPSLQRAQLSPSTHTVVPLSINQFRESNALFWQHQACT